MALYLEVKDKRDMKEKMNLKFYICTGFKLPNI